MISLFTKACVSLFIHLDVIKQGCCAGAEKWFVLFVLKL